MAATTSVSQANEDFDALLYSSRWSSTSITYSFPTSASFYGVNYGLDDETDAGFEVLNATQIAAVENIFAELESFTNLSFTEITETASTHATLRFGMTDNTATAHAYTPNSFFEEGGDAWFRNGGTYDNPVVGNFSYVTFAHELGHALGLRHGHTSDGFGALPSNLDTEELSIMTYRDYVGDTLDGSENETWGNPQSFMMLDIAALQYMYGADYSAAGNVWSGDSVYTFSSSTGEMFINGIGQGTPGGNRIFRTIWDGHGTDTYDFSNYSEASVINLNAGQGARFSTSQLADLNAFSAGFDARANIANALLFNNDTRSLIENAIGGSGNDLITGNEVANVLTGGAGDDTFYSSAGGDTLNGGIGTDTVNYSDQTGALTIDLVSGRTTGSRTDTLSSIENAVGGSGDDTIIVSGLSTNLDGGSAGFDTLDYSNVNEFLYIDLLDGRTGVNSNSGYSNTLTSIEAAIGGNNNDTLIGNNDANILRGGEGNDTLTGNLGNDTLDGGNGNDRVNYLTSGGGLVIDLIAGTAIHGAETDTLISIEWVLAGGGNDVIYGTTGFNVIHGWEGDDVFFGRGGNDFLSGQGGTDTVSYNGMSSALVIDLLNGRTTGATADTLQLIESAIGGSGDDRLVGSAMNNSLTGGDGMDTAVFASTRASFTQHTKFVGGEFVTTLTDNVGTDGTDTLKEIEALQFNSKDYGLTGIQQNNDSNVDGDAYNELLFYNVNTSSSFYVDIGAGGIGPNTYFQSSVQGWAPVGVADMMGTGGAQVLYQNSNSGALVGYGDNGAGGTGWTGYFPALPANWTFEGVGDFTGDGFNDLMIKGPTGDLFYYDRDSIGVDTGWVLIGATANIWDPVDIGDFDRDGFSDVLVQDRSTGTTYFMNIDGGVFSGWGIVTPGAGADWRAEAAADVNGDGYDDVIFRNQTTGQIWGVDMATKTWFAAAHLTSDWTVEGAIDHDNDGYEDIIIRQGSTGYHMAIDMNEGAFTGFDLVSTALGNDWMLI